jgi:monoamine oxidase
MAGTWQQIAGHARETALHFAAHAGAAALASGRTFARQSLPLGLSKRHMSTRNIIVVGAGLAGAAAALRSSELGCSITVIEARDRVGGRAYLKPFEDGNTPSLEYGGAWITPWHRRIRARAAELGLELRPRHPVTSRFWYRDGALHETPVAEAERARHERCLARVAADAMLLKSGHSCDEKDRPLTGISFASYLDRLSPPAATRGLFSAWWCVSGNGDTQSVAASEFLASCAYGDGRAEGMIDCWADTVSPGMSALAEAMIAKSKARLITGAPVAAIAQDEKGVTVTARNGTSLAGDACIVALGVNQLAAISFSPSLPPARSAAVARGHGGRSFKLWAKMRGVAPGTLVTGDGSGIEFAFAERSTVDGDAMVVCFGPAGSEARPGDPRWVKEQLSRLFPNAEMLASDSHDWVGDPFARGTWVAAHAGHEAELDSANWRPFGRIAFATSDTARDQAGWFEGAIIAGEDAAEWITADGSPGRS